MVGSFNLFFPRAGPSDMYLFPLGSICRPSRQVCLLRDDDQNPMARDSLRRPRDPISPNRSGLKMVEIS